MNTYLLSYVCLSLLAKLWTLGQHPSTILFGGFLNVSHPSCLSCWLLTCSVSGRLGRSEAIFLTEAGGKVLLRADAEDHHSRLPRPYEHALGPPSTGHPSREAWFATKAKTNGPLSLSISRGAKDVWGCKSLILARLPGEPYRGFQAGAPSCALATCKWVGDEASL